MKAGFYQCPLKTIRCVNPIHGLPINIIEIVSYDDIIDRNALSSHAPSCCALSGALRDN
jgi:hypothetical protein